MAKANDSHKNAMIAKELELQHLRDSNGIIAETSRKTIDDISSKASKLEVSLSQNISQNLWYRQRYWGKNSEQARLLQNRNPLTRREEKSLYMKNATVEEHQDYTAELDITRRKGKKSKKLRLDYSKNKPYTDNPVYIKLEDYHILSEGESYKRRNGVIERRLKHMVVMVPPHFEEVFVEDEPEPKSDEPLEEPVQESIEEPALDDDLPFGDLPEDEQFPEEEPLSEDEQLPKPQLQHETVKEELVPEEEDDDIPGFFDEPEIITVAAKASAAAKPTINDAHSTDQAWRKDMPGTPVKDIRSAISLNDRVFYINNLFNEDAQAFVNTLSSINSMASLDEVVDFVTDQFPHWNLNSDVVYRFMMAVRRKVK
jgi:hypothetical protein